MNWGAQIEWGHMRQVLMFRPGEEIKMVDKYTPEEMDFRQPVSLTRFQDEFDQLVSAFTTEGCEVVLVNDVLKNDPEVQRYIHRRPNMVFTRDLAAVTRGGAIISQMARKTRRGDIRHQTSPGTPRCAHPDRNTVARHSRRRGLYFSIRKYAGDGLGRSNQRSGD